MMIMPQSLSPGGQGSILGAMVDIIDELMRRTNGEILNAIQAASEMPDTYTVEEKLKAGLEEVTS